MKPATEIDLPLAVEACRRNGELLDRLREIYRQVDGWIEAAGLVCLGGGACCKFDHFDHRLYVTTGELALLAQSAPADRARAARRRCPWQAGPGCAAYSARPLGCRTFFCKGENSSDLYSLHERCHRQIALSHQICCTPYAYGDLFDFVMQLFADKRVTRGPGESFCP